MSGTARKPPLGWAIISGLAFLLMMGVAVLFVFFRGELFSIPAQIYYFMLIPVGFAAAAFLFGAMRSHAKYSGNFSYGQLELAGPVVVFALVVIGGYFLAPPENTFSLTVRAHGPHGLQDLITHGTIMLDLGGDRRTAALDPNGQAVFQEIPAKYLKERVHVLPQVPGYRSEGPAAFSVPSDRILTVGLSPIPDTTVISGTVLDRSGHILPGATISINSGLVESESDQNGNFRLPVPLAEGARVTLSVLIDGRVVHDEHMIASSLVPLRIRIDGSP